jgi:hypothetical protein
MAKPKPKGTDCWGLTEELTRGKINATASEVELESSAGLPEALPYPMDAAGFL